MELNLEREHGVEGTIPGVPPEDRAVIVARSAEVTRAFTALVPHNAALGIEVLELGDASSLLRLPYDPRFIGDPQTGVLHGGVITSLLDATFGAAAFMALPSPSPLATLDLRIDYLKPATPGQAVHGRGECYRVTRNVAFVRGIAYHDDPSAPIAGGSATFMLTQRPGSGLPGGSP